MTDSQMDAPDRIWVEYGQSGPEAMVWVGGSTIGLRKLPCYILATPEALAASPEVQALIAEAEARVKRIAAGLFPGGYDANFAKIEAAIRKGETP